MITATIIFLVLGILIKYGKMYFLIAGYNTMSKSEKQRYNIKGIANLFGNIMFLIAFFTLLGIALETWLNIPNAGLIAMLISLTIGLPYLLIKSNSERYKK